MSEGSGTSLLHEPINGLQVGTKKEKEVVMVEDEDEESAAASQVGAPGQEL